MYTIMDLRDHIVQKLPFMKYGRLPLPLLYNMLLFLLSVLSYMSRVRTIFRMYSYYTKK